MAGQAPLRFAAHSGDGVSVLVMDKTGAAVPDSSAPQETSTSCRVMGFSADGELFAVNNGKSVIVYKGSETVISIDRPRTIAIKFSPKGTQFATWENYSVRRTKDESGGQQQQSTPNFAVWDLSSGELLLSYIHRSFDTWEPQWTSDEKYLSRGVSNEVQFYDTTDYKKGVATRCVNKGMTKYRLSPGPGPIRVVTFTPVIKGAPASVRMYSEPNLSMPLSSKSFYKADKIQICWNNQGTACLVSTQTETDATGKSYYGETNLYYLAVKDQTSMQVILDKEGAISDFDWSPSGGEFCVVYGYMPAKAAVFNHKCDKVFDFGTGPRNFVKYSPHGNLILLGGFGNIASGIFQFWSRKDYTLVNQIEKRDLTSVQWCPDSRHILTATTSPRLKVDNGFTVWHYSKGQVFEKSYKELREVAWQPVPNGKLPEHPIEPAVGGGGKPGAAKHFKPEKKEAYRPPGLRGTSSGVKLHEDEPAWSQKEDNKPLSKAALKNKKKREAKARAAAGGDSGEAEATSAVQKPIASKKSAEQVAALQTAKTVLSPATPVTMASADSTQSVEKKIRNLNKKLRQIDALKEKQAAGETLQTNQVEKVKEEDEIKAEVAKLTEKLAQMS
eukprot:m.22112 g.22112  ORF g.22112 m.22112 type:complete len:614 (+) comp7343_c1_seq1:51-1892(+)